MPVVTVSPKYQEYLAGGPNDVEVVRAATSPTAVETREGRVGRLCRQVRRS